MALTCKPLSLPEVLCFVPDVFRDPRGFFLETCHAAKYAAFGMQKPFVQDNFSRSCGNTLRGLHYQARQPQAKLVAVCRGSIFDVPWISAAVRPPSADGSVACSPTRITNSFTFPKVSPMASVS